MSRVQFICQFSKPKTNPTALKPATTALSPYLKFGCLSARLFYWEVRQVYENTMHLELKPRSNREQQKKKKKAEKMREGGKGGRRAYGARVVVTKPPQSLEGQLLWREFFYFNSVAVANYDRMEGNPICRQIPWRLFGRDFEVGRSTFIHACDANIHILHTHTHTHTHTSSLVLILLLSLSLDKGGDEEKLLDAWKNARTG